jgi:hypothetical protein
MKHLIKQIAVGLLFGFLVCLASPFTGGCWYSFCGDRFEQEWLDKAIQHIQVLKNNCPDPELRGVLEYTITRYSRVGAWDVMVLPLANCWKGWKTLGCNCPWCPGITLDPEVLDYPSHEGALVLVHEAAHDYYPYFHPLVNPLMDKIEKLCEINYGR